METLVDYKTVRYSRPENELKQYKTKLEVVKKNDSLTQVQRDEILSFANSCIAENITPKRVCKYLRYLEMFGLILKKTFRESTKEDLEILWNTILLESRGKWSPYTLDDFKVTLKKFYKVMEGEGEEYPKKIRFLNHQKCIKPNLKQVLPELLLPDDIAKMIEATNNLMWRAFVSLLWDSGMRLYEQLSLKIADITVTDSGLKVRCRGKTGSREFPLLVECYGYLTQWLAHHPFREDREALVFINTSNNKRNRGLSSTGVHHMLKHIAKKAGVNKPIYPKGFRRSRATYLSSFMNEQELKQYFGWTVNSKVVNHYIFRNGKQLEDRIRQMHGLATKDDESKNKIKKCGRCMKLTPLGSKVCPFCAMPLTQEAAMEQKEKLENLEQIMPLLNMMKEMQPLLKRWAEEKGIII